MCSERCMHLESYATDAKHVLLHRILDTVVMKSEVVILLADSQAEMSAGKISSEHDCWHRQLSGTLVHCYSIQQHCWA